MSEEKETPKFNGTIWENMFNALQATPQQREKMLERIDEADLRRMLYQVPDWSDRAAETLIRLHPSEDNLCAVIINSENEKIKNIAVGKLVKKKRLSAKRPMVIHEAMIEFRRLAKIQARA